jgi:hypothetical protein
MAPRFNPPISRQQLQAEAREMLARSEKSLFCRAIQDEMKLWTKKQEYKLNQFAYSGAVLDIPEEVFQ